jgi:3-oxoacyl-[acyl-carrier protein] reductase
MDERKVALVTGGSRGIGRAICLELARTGYHVVVNYRSQDAAGEETLALLRAEGGDGELARFDVADGAAVKTSLDDLLARHRHVEVLVNNAGVVADGLFAMMPEADWTRVLATSLGGFFNVTKPVVNRMIQNRRGSIVTISSISGVTGNRGQTNYAAAKAGLIGASGTLATEVARLGVRVNVVAPGIIATDMTKDLAIARETLKQLIPMGRVGRPEEVARVVRWLCSDDASYVTRQVISVNGGMG